MQKYFQIEKIKENTIVIMDGEGNEIVIDKKEEYEKYQLKHFIFIEEDNSNFVINNKIDNNSSIFVNNWKSYIMNKVNRGILYTIGFKRLMDLKKNPDIEIDIKHFFEFAIKRARSKSNNLMKLKNKEFVNNLQHYMLILDNEVIERGPFKRKVINNLAIDYMIMDSKLNPTKLYIKSLAKEYLNIDSLIKLMMKLYEDDRQEEFEEIRVGKKLSEKDLEVFKRMIELTQKDNINDRLPIIKENKLKIFEYLPANEKEEFENNIGEYIFNNIRLYFERNREVKKYNLEKISMICKEWDRKKLTENFIEMQIKEIISNNYYNKFSAMEYLSKNDIFLKDVSLYIDIMIQKKFIKIALSKGYYGEEFINEIKPPLVFEESKKILQYKESKKRCMILFYTFKKYGEEKYNYYLATFGFESLKRFQELSDTELHQILQFIECDEINNGFVFEEYLTYN